LDFYFPELRFAIELNGITHYEPIYGEDKFEKIKNSFDYLLNLPIASLTLKHAQKHEKDLEELRKTIAVLEAKTPTDLWLDELSLVKGV
jgi:hypothetical protein